MNKKPVRLVLKFPRDGTTVELDAVEEIRKAEDQKRRYIQALAKDNQALATDIERDRPVLERDAKRQAGTRKERGSKMPRLDAWLDEKLKVNPELTNADLWNALPGSVTAHLHRNEDKACEYVDDRLRDTRRAGFDKRVTAARKRKKRR